MTCVWCNTLKCKDFYPCVADAVLDASIRICNKVIVEIVFMIFVQNPLTHGNAAAYIRIRIVNLLALV